MPLLPLGGAALVATLLDCGGGKPMANVMQFMESNYRDIEEARWRIVDAADESAPIPEGEFLAIADRATRIAALSDEQAYRSDRSAADFQGWREGLKARALDLEQAARRKDAAAVEEGYVAITDVMTACHRRYPVSPRQATPRVK